MSIRDHFITLPNGAWSLGCLEGHGAETLFRAFVQHWGLREDVANKALGLGECYYQQTATRLWIISGYRTEAEQRALQQSGAMAAEVAKSTHTSFPATGFDIGTDFDLSPEQWKIVGCCAENSWPPSPNL